MTTDTIQLHADWDGPGQPGQPTLVLLHGFSTNLTAWAPVRDGLRRIGPTLAVDLIGHGRSPAPHSPEPYRMEACLEQLEAVLQRLEIPRAWWVGYSMGGRVALQMAARKPGLVEGLVVESATAGIREVPLRRERIAADGELADWIETHGMAAFVERWLANPLFDGLTALPPDQLARQKALRMEGTPAGLANSLRGMGTGAMVPVWDALKGHPAPALILAGERDPKFAALAPELARLFPNGALGLIPSAGHSIHLEAPEAYLAAVSGFFDAI